MRAALIIILLFISVGLYSQNMADSFMRHKCEFITDGKGVSQGVKMKIFIPCAWDSVIDTRPFAVKSFGYTVPDSGMLACAIIILKTGFSPKASDKENIFKKEWAQSVFKSTGSVVSVRKVRIDSHDWAEYMLESGTETPQGFVQQYFAGYYTYYQDRIIYVTYKTMARESKVALLLFSEYLDMFRAFASGISVFNFRDKFK